MDREDLFHVVAAAAQITKEEEFVVIGSQAIVGVYPGAPDEMLLSIEADIYPKNKPERWELIDGAIALYPTPRPEVPRVTVWKSTIY